MEAALIREPNDPYLQGLERYLELGAYPREIQLK
jgi:hypothetical protein